ncbi:MAG: hypothetical protein ACJ76I_02205 [Gaiellaceae bacterium]
MSVEDHVPGGSEIVEMRRILRKVLERERLTASELEFLHLLRIDALEHFTGAR